MGGPLALLAGLVLRDPAPQRHGELRRVPRFPPSLGGASSTAVSDAEVETHGDGAFAAPTSAEEPKKRRGRSKQSHAAKDKRKRRRNAENPSAAPDGPAALDHTDGSGADSKA